MENEEVENLVSGMQYNWTHNINKLPALDWKNKKMFHRPFRIMTLFISVFSFFMRFCYFGFFLRFKFSLSNFKQFIVDTENSCVNFTVRTQNLNSTFFALDENECCVCFVLFSHFFSRSFRLEIIFNRNVFLRPYCTCWKPTTYTI